MPRHFKKISLKELQEKLSPILDDEDFPYNLGSHPTISRDLDKVQFDYENCDYTNGFSGYPAGYEILPNGMPVLYVSVGGDWEHPIMFCLYYDGKKVRAYIPKEGNVWNRKTKSAYGNEPRGEEVEESEIPNADPDAIKKDIMARITEKG